MGESLPPVGDIEATLRRVFVERLGTSVTVRQRGDDGWPMVGHVGVIVAADRYGVRLALQGEGGARFPEWIGYREFWIQWDSPYRQIVLDTPELQEAIEAALRGLRSLPNGMKEVIGDVAPVA